MSSRTPVAPGPSQSEAAEDERRELEAVAAALSNSSRLVKLVTYIGDKYFQGETGKLHEYEIATEVFGRSKSTFNAGEDAIVRVEAHRLRKRLKEYYESEGKDHPIQLSIPPGCYVPVFTRRSEPAAGATSESAPPGGSIPAWMYAAAAAVLILILAASWFFFARHGASRKVAPATASLSPAASSVGGGAFAKVPLRILAGYSGESQIDSAGNVWQPDEYVQYGGNWEHPGAFIQRTSDPMLYQHWRNGDFYYEIPLRPGVYELHLYFNFTVQDPNSSGPSAFSVSANGKPLLAGFDIASDALGSNIADERVFRDISPATDGFLHLSFTSEGAPAELNALEILPGLPHSLLPIRIVTQPTSFTDRDGNLWHPDNYYLGGYSSEKHLTVAGTPDPAMYAGERYGHFSYAIPVDSRDQYTLVLHFAELYFGPNASGVGGVESRVFDVSCNGQTLLDHFDIYKEAGSLHALTKTFYHLKPTAQGKLNITFDPIVNNATVSAIEVLDESQ